MLTLIVAAAGDLAFRLSNTVHSSAIRYILCLSRCSLRCVALASYTFHITGIAVQHTKCYMCQVLISVATLAGATYSGSLHFSQT